MLTFLQRQYEGRLGEFKEGDVIVKVGGFLRYRVVESDPKSPDYKLEFRNSSEVIGISELDKEYIDKDYVKVD